MALRRRLTFDLHGLQNCYMYATGLPYSEPGLKGVLERKVSAAERCLGPYTCDKLRKGALADGLRDGSQYESCPLGWAKVAYFEGNKRPRNFFL